MMMRDSKTLQMGPPPPALPLAGEAISRLASLEVTTRTLPALSL